MRMPLAARLSLAQGEVEIWGGALDLLDADATLLDAAERARAERYRFAADRQHFVAGRAALRRCLARYCGLGPAQIAFATSREGKLSLASDGPAFNLAHAGGRILIAIAAQGRVGVDLEPVRPARAKPEIAGHYFHPAEAARLAAQPADDFAGGFFAIWTAKEAVIKAVGLGMAIPLDSFAVDPEAPPAAALAVEPSWTHGGPWHLQRLEAGEGWRAALCCDFLPRAIHRRNLDQL